MKKRPAGDATHGPRLIALNAPAVVEVRTDARGDPAAVRRGRRWVAVTAERERWRIDDEWWRRPVSRSYHVVVLGDGALVTLYRDRADGRWYEQG